MSDTDTVKESDVDAPETWTAPDGPFTVYNEDGVALHETGNIHIALAQLALPGVNDAGEARYTSKRSVTDGAGNPVDVDAALVAFGLRRG